MPEPASARQVENFATLDGLRGVAAIAVAAGHGRFLAVGEPTGLFSGCYLAVDFFFMLSGFVLAHAYGARLRSDLSPAQFMLRRLIRLYPLYLLALFLSLGLAGLQLAANHAAAHPTATEIVFGLLMLPDPFPRALSYPLNSPDLLFPMNIPAWSLFFELVCNALMAVSWKRVSDSALLSGVVVSAIVLALAVAFRWLGFGTLPERFSAGAVWASAWGGLARVLFSFFAGTLIFKLWRRTRRRPSVPPMLLVGILLVVLALPAPRQLEVPYALSVAMLVFPALVFLGASAVPRRLIERLFGWMGSVSYGVYVLQQAYYVTITAAVAALSGRNFTGLPWPQLAAILLLLPPLATLAHRHYDVPLRRWLLDRLGTPRSTGTRRPVTSDRARSDSAASLWAAPGDPPGPA